MSSLPNDSAKRPALKERIRAFFHERLGLEVAEALAAKKTVPRHRSTAFYFLGGMALFLFGVQIVTGALLSMYYKPSPDQAFESVRAIMTEVEFGWLIRSVHSWSANLLVGILFVHMLTTYMMRAYRQPREITWLTGILLLGVFMVFGFSGYLLPWNELAFFATRVGTAIAGVVPVVGDYLLRVARSGDNVTGDTLARFYALHVVICPLIVFGLLGIHLFLVQQHGMSIPDHEVAERSGRAKVPTMPFVPHFLLRDMLGWYLVLGILAALAAFFPWGLGEKASPFGTAPAGIKPEWYFLFMFQALKEIPAHVMGLEGEILGVMFFAFGGLVVMVVPFLDRGQRSRLVLNVLAAVWVAFIIVMTAWGWFSAPGEQCLMVILGAGLSLGMLLMLFPFRTSGGPELTPRFTMILSILTALAALTFVVAIVLHFVLFVFGEAVT